MSANTLASEPSPQPQAQAQMVFDSPCDADLDSMPSFDGGRRRFCSDCMRSVHNLSGMTRAEAQTFVRANPGACMSYERGRDGRLMFRPASRALVPSERLARRPRASLAAPVLALAGCTAAAEGPAQLDDPIAWAAEDDATDDIDLADRAGSYASYSVLPDQVEPCEPEPEPEPKPNNEKLDGKGTLPKIGHPGHYAGGIGARDFSFPEEDLDDLL